MSASAFANNLRRIRASQGLTATRVAKELGISLNSVSQYELGNREPNILTIKRLADYLGVSVDELFEGVTDAPLIDRQAEKVPWEMIGYNVVDVDDQFIRIEPSAEIAAVRECVPIELNKALFGKLTRTMLEESQKKYPDDRSLANMQFEIWAMLMTSKQAALRREDPFKVINSFVPIEYLPPSADRRSTTETKKASD